MHASGLTLTLTVQEARTIREAIQALSTMSEFEEILEPGQLDTFEELGRLTEEMETHDSGPAYL